MRHARLATFILLVAGALGALGAAAWIASAGGDPPTGVMRGFWMIGHSRFEPPVLGALALGAVTLGALAWLVRGGRTWPLVTTLVGAVVLAVLAWLVRDWIVSGETPRYRHKSPYVRGANAAALLAIAYAVLVAIAATIALVATRRAARPAPQPTSSAPST